MRLQYQICLTYLIPIVIPTIIMFAVPYSQWYPQNYQMIDSLKAAILNETEVNVNMFGQTMRIDLEIQYKNIAKCLIATGNLVRGIMTGYVKINPDYTPLLISAHNQQQIDDYYKVSQKNSKLKDLYSSYDHLNFTYINEFPDFQRQQVKNLQVSDLIFRSLVQSESSQLEENNYYIVLQRTGLSYDFPPYILPKQESRRRDLKTAKQAQTENLNQNSTWKSNININTVVTTDETGQKEIPQKCPYLNYPAQYLPEWRCQEWYFRTQKEKNIVFPQPYLDTQDNTLVNSICDKVLIRQQQIIDKRILTNGMRRNLQSQPAEYEGDLYAVLCIDYYVNSLNKQYRDRIKNGKESYMYQIFPVTKKVIAHPNFTSTGEKTIIEYQFGEQGSYKERANEVSEYNQKLNQVLQLNDQIRTENCKFEIGLSQGDQFYNNTFTTQIQKSEFFHYLSEISICDMNQVSVNDISPHLQKYRHQHSFIMNVIKLSKVESQTNIVVRNLNTVVSLSLTIAVFVTFTLLFFLIYKSIKISNVIIEPIHQLTDTMISINPERLEEAADVFKNQELEVEKEISLDMQILYNALYTLINVLNVANESFMHQQYSIALLNYAQAEQFFLLIRNQHGRAICLTNMGVVHLRNHRYAEAFLYFKRSLIPVEEDWNEFQEKYGQFNISHKIMYSDEEFNRLTNLVIMRRLYLLQSLKEGMCKNYENMIERIQKELFFNTKQGAWNYLVREFYSLIELINLCIESRILYDSRIPYFHIQISFCFLQLGQFSQGEKQLDFASQALLIPNSILYQYLNIPKDILNSQILFHRGLISRARGNLKESATYFTSCIENGTHYDPSDRLKCLQNLKEVMIMSDIQKIGAIEYLLDQFKPVVKDILISLDVSREMGKQSRLIGCLKNILHIFDNYLHPYDRIGYVAFNEMIFQIFPFQIKEQNQAFYRKIFHNVPTTKGFSNIIQLLEKAIEMYSRPYYLNIKNQNQKQVGSSFSYRKFVFIFTEGSEILAVSNYKLDQIKEKLILSSINLVIFTFTKDPDVIERLTQLANSTQQGILITEDQKQLIDSFFLNIGETETAALHDFEM